MGIPCQAILSRLIKVEIQVQSPYYLSYFHSWKKEQKLDVVSLNRSPNLPSATPFHFVLTVASSMLMHSDKGKKKKINKKSLAISLDNLHSYAVKIMIACVQKI